MALLPGSPAIDAGTSTGAPATDQRGIARPQGSAVDIGAFESQGFTIAVFGGNNQSTVVNTAFTNSLVVHVIANDPIEPVIGGVVTCTGPSSGASISPNPSTATIGSNGQANLTTTAITVAGSYTVMAPAAGVATPASFSLTNTLATPSITTSQQPPSATVNSSIADQASLSGEDNPTGTVTFNLYNNPNGTGPALFTDTESLATNGTATSANYMATATGTDYWVATHNGDSNNSSVSSGTADEPVTINKARTTTTISASATSSSFGQAVTFTATATANPSGPVTPTGLVDFVDSTTLNDLGTATLSGGTAALTVSSVSAHKTCNEFWACLANH
jgi:hypothetical protein